MPQLVRHLAVADFANRRGRGQPHIDLTVYREFLDGLPIGDGGVLELEEGENQRVVKRRLSMAAGERAAAIKWRTAARGQLRFQLIERKPGPVAASPPPGATNRGRGGRSHRQAERAAS